MTADHKVHQSQYLMVLDCHKLLIATCGSLNDNRLMNLNTWSPDGGVGMGEVAAGIALRP